ncbi:hypothetical protein L21SP2_2085 [Salinispira pacifica]|uniref:Uncharacterized protein n=1 Tax=Salinispira pacifica TaxID=1307761 RepID=V5WHZ7_9SPIO|nr:hypothetical protein L21SP2_2085 [Salinispira pacifica]
MYFFILIHIFNLFQYTEFYLVSFSLYPSQIGHIIFLFSFILFVLIIMNL